MLSTYALCAHAGVKISCNLPLLLITKKKKHSILDFTSTTFNCGDKVEWIGWQFDFRLCNHLPNWWKTILNIIVNVICGDKVEWIGWQFDFRLHNHLSNWWKTILNIIVNVIWHFYVIMVTFLMTLLRNNVYMYCHGWLKFRWNPWQFWNNLHPNKFVTKCCQG